MDCALFTKLDRSIGLHKGRCRFTLFVCSSLFWDNIFYSLSLFSLLCWRLLDNFSLLFIGQQGRDFFCHPDLQISHWLRGYTNGMGTTANTMPPSLSKTPAASHSAYDYWIYSTCARGCYCTVIQRVFALTQENTFISMWNKGANAKLKNHLCILFVLRSKQPGQEAQSISWDIPLKVHKIENFFGSEFEFYTISLLVMLKY